MIFEKEEWTMVADDDPRTLLDAVSNVVDVVPRRASAYRVCARVPSAFFPFMRDVLKVRREEALEKPVSFLLEEVDSDRWIFAADCKNGTGVVDLWFYKDLPYWAGRHRCL